MVTVRTVSAETELRAAAVAETVHSAALEGQALTPAMQSDVDAYAGGVIDLDELEVRTLARYGLG